MEKDSLSTLLSVDLIIIKTDYGRIPTNEVEREKGKSLFDTVVYSRDYICVLF